MLCARRWDCKLTNSYRSCDHERIFLFFIFRGQIGQELFEMFKIDHDSTWASDMDVGWEYFSCEFGIWLSDISKQWYFEGLCASGSSRPPPPKLSGELGSQAPYVTLLHTELGSPDGFGGGGREGPLAHRLRRRSIEVFDFFFFFNITIEIARAYGKFSNLKIVEVMCMHLGCISKLS